MKEPSIFKDSLRVINIGLASFAEDLDAEGVKVVQVDWRPPGGGNPRLAALLVSLQELE